MEDKKAESFEYQSVQVLKGVGQAVAEKLKRLEIYNIQDVLFPLPLRYEDRTKITALGSLQQGQQALVEGTVDHCEIKYGGRGRRSLLCYLSDNTDAIVLRFFHFNKSQQANLSSGTKLRCFGEVRRGATRLELIHPEYQIIQQNDVISEQSLTPVYPKTEGVHQTLLKKLSDQVLSMVSQGYLVDWLPAQVMHHHQFPDLMTALYNVHRPHKNEQVFALNECKTKAAKLSVSKNDYASFIDQLCFTLTRAQEKVIAEIFADINCTQPMLRLVQGDVGSGKTVVAAAAAMAVVNAGFQLAVMAPTEILAGQHFVNFKQWFGEQKCLLLTGKDKGKKRQQKLALINNGECQVIIGTHALFQDVV